MVRNSGGTENAIRIMPHDVSTRWNSTYNMLCFAIEYQAVLNTITGECDMKLREYELTAAEWAIAIQLRDLLKVFEFIL